MTKKEVLTEISGLKKTVLTNVAFQPNVNLPHHPEVERALAKLRALAVKAEAELSPEDFTDVRMATFEVLKLAPARFSAPLPPQPEES